MGGEKIGSRVESIVWGWEERKWEVEQKVRMGGEKIGSEVESRDIGDGRRENWKRSRKQGREERRLDVKQRVGIVGEKKESGVESRDGRREDEKQCREQRVNMGGEKIGSGVESRDGRREDWKWSREQGWEERRGEVQQRTGGIEDGKQGSIVKFCQIRRLAGISKIT